MTRIPLSTVEEESRSLQARLEMSTAEIGLSVRTTNCLEERGIFTVRDLLNCSRDDLLEISNFGEKTLEEVYAALESIGFYRPSKQPKVPVRRPPKITRPSKIPAQPQRGKQGKRPRRLRPWSC